MFNENQALIYAEPCEDCISRAEVRHLIVETDRIGGISCGAFKTLYNGIDELPPVTPKQRMGRWINDREVIDKSRKPTTYHFETHCSECGFKSAYTTDKEDSIPTNYCPNCGAKMTEQE